MGDELMIATAEYELTLQLSTGAVDADAGILRGATVAQAGVTATGKFLLLDAKGKPTGDPKLAVKKLPLITDEKTLDTLMAAAVAAGGTLKVRSDHDDSLESRAGYADNFQKVGNRVTADLHLNTSYRDRAIVLETAQKTPKLIGLSIDMTPSFEVTKDSALMRIEELSAVDIVDEGAITPAGMFLKRGVDKELKVTISAISPTTIMADKTDPTVSDCMSAIAALTKTVGELAAQMAKPPVPDKAAMSAAVDEMRVQLKADFDKEIASVKETVASVKTEKSKLGLKSGEVIISTVEELETERARLAAEKSKGAKPYLTLVAEKAEAVKCKRSEAHTLVQQEHPTAYAAHLKAKGIVAA